MRRVFAILLMIGTLILSSCGDMGYDDVSYENVKAVITEINANYFFAGTHRYMWNIEVYYEPYDLYYTQTSESSGAFNAPSFFNARKEDTINARIRNTYLEGELISREIISIW